MPTTSISIAVAGAGPVDTNTVTELLDDWLGIDANGEPTTHDEVAFLFPAAQGYVTAAVKVIYNWTGQVEPEPPYTAIVGHTLDKAAKVIREGADDVIAAADGDNVYASLGEAIASSDGDRFLLVARGDEDGEELAELVNYLHGEDVAVLDLRDALKQIAPPTAAQDGDNDGAAEDPAPGDEQEPCEEPCEGGIQTLVPLPEQPKDAPAETEVQPYVTPELCASLEQQVANAHHQAATRRTSDTTAGAELDREVIAILEDVTRHLRLLDEADAAARLSPVRYRPVTERAIQVLERAKQASVQTAAADEVDAPDPTPSETSVKRLGGKVRKEWLNPESGAWEPLRGRPRKDVEIREVAA
ncbi:hypothetical protein ACFWAP_00535 [Streptomyces goshikiensis]|uniref:hypothetical protein n=1 Tax=Streptomyces goshikiensis TaxID=1942 RepID=UPI003657AA56